MKELMFAKVILASTCEGHDPVYTMQLHMPRCLLAEFNTHRVFSRSSRSSRAVPVAKMIKEVYDAPFIPWHWGKNQPGMKAEEKLTPSEEWECLTLWNDARDRAAEIAQQLDLLNAHKQNVNRILEPYLWVDTLVTATQWDNFFHLRDHEDAEPHFQDLVKMMKKAMAEATPQKLEPVQWHLPYINADEQAMLELEDLRKISAARCARVSYAPFDGNASYEKEFARFEKLAGDPPHSSAFEHILMADDDPTGDHRNTPGWLQFRTMIPNDTYLGE